MRIGDGGPGTVTDAAGTSFTSTFASDPGNTKAVTVDASILKLNPIPAGFYLGAYCAAAPTAGSITMTLYGEVYEPVDHRLL